MPCLAGSIPTTWLPQRSILVNPMVIQLHRRIDCAIKLVENATLPQCQASQVENQVMEQEALPQGCISPTVSTALTSIFVKKKDGGLHTCRLQGLKHPAGKIRSPSVPSSSHPRTAPLCKPVLQLEKCASPAPLMSCVIETSICMQSNKVKAVIQCLQPQMLCEHQHCLGFANLSRWFIHSYSSMAQSRTNLLQGQQTHLSWSLVAEDAFTTLRKVFITASILMHPNSSVPFTRGRYLPCGSRSVGIAGVEHWLKDTQHPPVVITDHKNLQYL
ncbi:hypothetical protein P4O66_009037 [Electrophorus voltai]|uniref:Reverse transcriptase RNase H-like domain-containing protein n=1 Tax=Electrophorus voltai TaxID=2609070 RepID=A0AAD8ZAX4_9TELE|nr:hypothetical protein P4O66_009037 [Electrophorus voltai]